MKTHLHSIIITIFLIVPAFCLAQCGGTLMINTAPSGSACYGTPVTITLTGVGAGWNFKIYKDSISASTKISTTTSAHDTLTTMPWTIYYATADSTGCAVKEDSDSITVNPLPLVFITPDDTTVCWGYPVQLDCSSGGTHFSWSPGIFLSDSNIYNPLAYLLTTTTYTLTVIGQFGCINRATTTVTLYPSPPTPNITQSNDTLYCSTDPSYVSYQWYVDDTLIVGATDTFIVIPSCGNYNVQVTDSDGCSVAVGIPLPVIPQDDGPCGGGGIVNYVSNNLLIVSPNPATNQLTMHNPSIHSSSLHTNEIVTVSVMNVLGQEASLPTPLQERGESIVVDVSNLPPGIYFVQLITEKERWMGRFVKQ